MVLNVTRAVYAYVYFHNKNQVKQLRDIVA